MEEIDVAAMLNLIEQEASDLQTNEIILDEIYKLEKFDVISDSEVDEIKDKFKKKHALFREVLNKKTINVHRVNAVNWIVNCFEQPANQKWIWKIVDSSLSWN